MEFIEVLRYFGALLLVLALIGVAGLAARRFGVTGIPGVTKPARDRRLAIVETLLIGPRQRLYLIRRDGVEHLLFAGPEGAHVVESAITPPVRRADMASP